MVRSGVPSPSWVTVDTFGYRGPVQVRIDGPADAVPLVLLHGFGGSLHWVQPVVPLLADRHRIIRVDLLGHGATGGPGADAPGQAIMVEAVLAALDVRGAVAVGHSFGADVAAELAEKSDRIERLVIVMQGPDYSDATLPRGRMLMTVPGLRSVLRGLGVALALPLGRVARARRGPAAGALATQAVRDLRALDIRMFRVILVERRDRLARRPLDAQVHTTGKPSLVLLGGRDHFYGDRAAARYRRAGAQVEILPGSGHSPFLDEPGPAADVIRAFLA